MAESSNAAFGDDEVPEEYVSREVGFCSDGTWRIADEDEYARNRLPDSVLAPCSWFVSR